MHSEEIYCNLIYNKCKARFFFHIVTFEINFIKHQLKYESKAYFFTEQRYQKIISEFYGTFHVCNSNLYEHIKCET